MSIKITRAMYLADSSNLHHDYYAQFVTPRILNVIRYRVSTGNLDLKVYAADKEVEYASEKVYTADYFGNLISQNNWDVAALMRDAGDYITRAGSVCVMKCAADIVLAESLSK